MSNTRFVSCWAEKRDFVTLNEAKERQLTPRIEDASEQFDR